MIVINNTLLVSFFRRSVDTLRETPYSAEYFHTLFPEDEKPVVIHKKTHQCTLVLEGKGKVIVDGITRDICTDDIICIEANNTHQFVAETPLTLFHIHIPFETENSDRFIVEGKDFELH